MLTEDLRSPALTVGSTVGRHGYDTATLLARQVDQRLARKADSLCMGMRHFGKPMMAITAKQEMGPVRHALSQMVVAGVMTSHPPIQVRVYSPFGDVIADQDARSDQPAPDAVVETASAEGDDSLGLADEMTLPVEEGPQNTVYEMSLGSPDENRVYQVDPNESEKTSN